MVTSQMTVRIAHTVTASATTNTNWIYTHGMTKADVSYYWTGDQETVLLVQGTNAPVAYGGDFQPEPAATEIFTVNNFALPDNPAGTASTASSEEAYDNVLPMWIRVNAVESAGEAGVVNFVFNFKSAS